MERVLEKCGEKADTTYTTKLQHYVREFSCLLYEPSKPRPRKDATAEATGRLHDLQTRTGKVVSKSNTKDMPNLRHRV